MAVRTDLILDQWTPLAHKSPIASHNDGTLAQTLAPTWIPTSERRRLDAYKILAAYRSNAARHLIDGIDPADADKRREYGDAALLIRRVAAAVLGQTITPAVLGAEPPADRPDLPEPPEPLGDDAPAIEREIHRLRQERWERDAEAAVTAWAHQLDTQPALAEREAWLAKWAEDEHLAAKLLEGEDDTVGLGDSVYRLVWNPRTRRPALEVWDPGFYFPVLTHDDDGDGFPDRVHLAYEFDEAGKRYVRRLTWELVPIWDSKIDPWTGEYREVLADGSVPYEANEWQLADGRLARRLPWHTDDDPETWATVTCLFSDATWPLNELGSRHVDDLTDQNATWAVTDDGHLARRLDLGFDFIPLIHTPNTPASRTHYGRSLLDVGAQLLDDIAAIDTDIQAAAALAAGPAIGLSGTKESGALSVRPGAVYNLGEGGRMDVLDLSAGLQTLVDVGNGLQERLATNVQVPAEVQGRVKASEVPSGIALLLAFSPFEQLIGSLRLTRGPKHRLLLKQVQRLAQVHGVLPEGPTPDARIRLGSYLPTDLASIVELVVKLLGEHGISRATALRLLAEKGGLPIGDIDGELAAIRADDTEGAVHVAEATASEQLAADRLGVELPERPTVEAPTITLPEP